MTAADRSRKTLPPRFVAFFKSLAARSMRTGSAARTSADRHTSSPPLDLGNLAVAQFVHDLRNQLTVIIGCADDISHEVPMGHADEAIAELRACAERASMLTQELLLASRPRTVARRRVDLNDVVTPAAVTLSRFTGDRIRLRLRLAAGPIQVVAEPLELERIILNLALNARDAMTEGGVLTIETAVAAEPPQGMGDGARLGPWARLTVTDTGGGIAPEIKRRVFEPFFTTRAAGTGLGLSSVAHTVRQLQGTVALDSQPGSGTSVTVFLPLGA